MKLGLGTVQFGVPYGISNKAGKVSADEVGRILRVAAAEGIRFLDTAAGYGNSEAVLGVCLAQSHGFCVVTKTLPLNVNVVRAEDVSKAETTFEDSLRHLGQKAVYGLLVHHSADLLNPGGDRLYASLQRWKSEGRVSKIGASVYAKDEVERLLERYVLDLIQLPLNVFDQRLVHDGTLQLLHAAGIEVHARSAFLQGLLLMPSRALPPYFGDLKRHHETYLSALTQIGVSPLAGALGYLHRCQEVSTVLVGVETSKQLQECIVAVRDTPSIDYTNFAFEDSRMLDPRGWR